MSKRAAAPMRLSEVVSNTSWESLQRVGADCCQCSSRSSKYFNAQLRLRTWVLDIVMKGKLDL